MTKVFAVICIPKSYGSGLFEPVLQTALRLNRCNAV